MSPNRSARQQILLANQRRAASDPYQLRRTGGQMREDRQRPAYGSGYPMMGATSQAVQAPSIQAKPGLGQMARGQVLNAAMNEGMDVATPYVKEGMNTAKEKLVEINPLKAVMARGQADPSMDDAAIRAAQLGGSAGDAAAMGAAQPGFMNMLSGLGAQMGPMMMQYGMPILGAYALSQMLSRGGYVGPLSKKG